jgi:hypothetical protein
MAGLVKKYSIGTLRWPMGTISQMYAWNTADENGRFCYPIRSRVATMHAPPAIFPWKPADDNGYFQSGKEEMKFDEFLDIIKETGAMPVICVTFMLDMFKDSFFNYDDLLAIVREQVRYAKEVKGVTGMYWQIGNEIENMLTDYYDKDPAVSVPFYVKRYTDLYDVIHGEDPTAKVGPSFNRNPKEDDGRAWIFETMRAVKDKMEFVVNHQYGTNFKGAPIKTYDDFIGDTRTNFVFKAPETLDFVKELGGDYADNIEILITEYSAHRGYVGGEGGWASNGCILYKALYNAIMIGDMLNLPKLTQTHFWITRSPWGEMGIKDHDVKTLDCDALSWDGTPTMMGITVCTAAKHMKTIALKAETSTITVRPFATMDKGTGAAAIMLVNKNREAVAAKVTLINAVKGGEGEVYVLKGKNDDPFDTEYIYEKTGAAAVDGDGFDIILNPLSVTYVEL